jgi:hypothetical protein
VSYKDLENFQGRFYLFSRKTTAKSRKSLALADIVSDQTGSEGRLGFLKVVRAS